VASEGWTIEGTLMIACNCDYGCPCNVNGRPTTGKCEGGWTWHVDSGRYGTTALDDLNFSIFADWPGAIHEGGGRAVSYIDARADEGQQQAIEALVRGEAGGPWAIFITTSTALIRLRTHSRSPMSALLPHRHQRRVAGRADPEPGDRQRCPPATAPPRRPSHPRPRPLPVAEIPSRRSEL
jgi:hypothetical protein